MICFSEAHNVFKKVLQQKKISDGNTLSSGINWSYEKSHDLCIGYIERPAVNPDERRHFWQLIGHVIGQTSNHLGTVSDGVEDGSLKLKSIMSSDALFRRVTATVDMHRYTYVDKELPELHGEEIVSLAYISGAPFPRL